MAQDYVTMRLEFIRLQQDAERLAERLNDVGKELKKTGALDGAVEDHLSQLLHDWDTLDRHLSSDDADVNGASSSESLKLHGLAEKLEFHQNREQAKVILHRLQEIQLADGTDSPELRNIHREMRVLEDMLNNPEAGPVVDQLVEGTHAGNALLSLIRDGDRLSDRDWAQLQERVAKAYGTLIATAAVRGRLTIEGKQHLPAVKIAEEASHENKVTVITVTRDGKVVADTPAENDSEADLLPMDDGYQPMNEVVTLSVERDDTEERSEFESDHSDSFYSDSPRLTLLKSGIPELALHDESVDERSDESIFDASEAVVESQGPALIKDQSAEWQELKSAVFDDVAEDEDSRDETVSERSENVDAMPKTSLHDGGPVQVAARAVRSEAALYRDRHVSDVILHLAADDRLGLATYVARGQEARGELQVPFLPSWLLEAMTIAPHVTFVRGRLAAMIEETLSHCHERIWHDLSNDRREGLGFFVRAATLRPSVVSPGTRAAAILRSFTLNTDCIELDNYCARIATFGERLQGLMPALFTKRQSNLSREDHLCALQAEVRQWSELLAERTIEYAPVKQLFLHANWSVKTGSAVRHSLHVRRWQKWQQTLRLSEKIIGPVRDGESEMVPEVKAEVRRLSGSLREGIWAESDGDTDSDGLIRLPHPAMRNVLREAMAYAQRWVGLHSSSADEADFFLPQAAEELRSEVLDRHEAVVRELEGVREQSQSTVVAAGVTCLLRAVHQLREMVDPTEPVDPSEPDPRHLLSAELFKIPGMRLDERWEPPMDAVTVQGRILQFLADPQPDWQTAFQVRCESGDRIATDRLLELDVWDSSEQRDLLRDVREQYIQPTRASLMSELIQFERRLQEIADKESLPDNQEELEKRIRRLRDSLGSEASHSESASTIEWCRVELSALRNGMRALQSGEPPEPFPTLPEPENGLPDDHLLH